MGRSPRETYTGSDAGTNPCCGCRAFSYAAVGGSVIERARTRLATAAGVTWTASATVATDTPDATSLQHEPPAFAPQSPCEPSEPSDLFGGPGALALEALDSAVQSAQRFEPVACAHGLESSRTLA